MITRAHLRQHLSRAILLLLWLCVIASVYLFLQAEGVKIRTLPHYIRGEVLEAGIFGPIILFIAYQAVTIIPFPTAALSFIAGSLFGPWWGSLIVVVSLNVASWLSFWFARYFGRHFVRESHGKWVRRFDEWMHEDGFYAVLIARLLYIPFEYVGVAAGLSTLSFRQYAVASLLGMLPSTVTFVVLGDAFTDPRAWFLFGGLMVVIIAFTIFLMRSRWVKRILPVASDSDKEDQHV